MNRTMIRMQRNTNTASAIRMVLSFSKSILRRSLQSHFVSRLVLGDGNRVELGDGHFIKVLGDGRIITVVLGDGHIVVLGDGHIIVVLGDGCIVTVVVGDGHIILVSALADGH